MSLYNMLFGVNPASGILLKMIGINMNEIPRFRDCYVNSEEKTIVIYTRTGGGNRECYSDNDDHSKCYHTLNDALAEKQNYVKDYDDDFDSTYAYFVFKPLKEYEELFDVLCSETKDKPLDVGDKFNKLISKLSEETKTA